MKRKKWVNKVIALLLAAIMIVPSSLGTVAYAQEPEVSSEQTQTIQNADEDISIGDVTCLLYTSDAADD